MKMIVLSISVIFLSLQSNADDIALVNCKDNPLTLICASTAPVGALVNIFKNDFPNVSFSKTMPNVESKGGVSVFGGKEQATYVEWTQNPDRSMFQKMIGSSQLNLVRMYQGIEGKDACHYEYKIEKHKNSGRRICTVSKEAREDEKCRTIILRDPLLHKKVAMCEEFIQAVLSCSKNDDSMQKCKNTLMAEMGKHDGETVDTSKPRANPNAKPLPELKKGSE